MRLVVVTGLSGSGKTAALKVLEDIGFFCVDNLPVVLLPKFVQLSVLSGEMVNKVGIGMDSRERKFAEQSKSAFEEVERLGIHTEVIFFEADDEVLLRRFSETRRKHPLADKGMSVAEGIACEITMMAEVKDRADLVIDTSKMSVHDLKKTLWSYFSKDTGEANLQINLVSFGYRNGLPNEADLVMDVRFLPNPYFVPELKKGVGTDREVAEFVLASEEAREVLDRLASLLEYLVPMYRREGKRYLTIAIGCTGGRHRSVVIVEELGRRLASVTDNLSVLHRDMDK